MDTDPPTHRKPPASTPTSSPRNSASHPGSPASTGRCPAASSNAGMRCGKRHCRCKNDPPQLHGPYIQWTRTVNGKTVTKLLTPEQLSRYQPWLDNTARLRGLVTELEALTIQAVINAEGWGS